MAPNHDPNEPGQSYLAVVAASAEVVLTTTESLVSLTAVTLTRLIVSVVVLYAVVIGSRK